MKKYLLILSVLIFAFASSCQKPAEQEEKKAVVDCRIDHVDWSKDAVIYEVNIRQYTPEGTFNAFSEQIPRLKELGVDILWLMPIHPIGEKNRKGTLGSYYSVRDYKDVNPEYGSLEDFKALVAKAHENGMYVIIDWVANHTAWDNKWIEEHPEWYATDSTGNFFGPFDWSDVAQLNYENTELQRGMIEALEYWVSEADIDGYRCDVAGMVPRPFWDNARTALNAIKPVFMLAEDEANHGLLEDAFDINYGWHLHHIMNEIAKGNDDVNTLKKYYSVEDSIYPKDCYRMQFITNHDENSWNGTEFERMGDGVKTFAVMSFTVPGMPLLYTGQEYGMTKRLEFFEKDEVTYEESDFPEFYKSLIDLKKGNSLFWNGTAGGDFKILNTGNDKVFAFMRYTQDKEAFVILNLSAEKQEIVIPENIAGAYTDYFGGGSKVLNGGDKSELEPWSYNVYIE